MLLYVVYAVVLVITYIYKYLDDGIAFRILSDTKTEKYVFGIAWIDKAKESENRDIQTWFAADVTI